MAKQKKYDTDFNISAEDKLTGFDSSDNGKTKNYRMRDISDFVTKNLALDQAEVKIQGAFVETEGKTDITQFEVSDRFRYWHGDNLLFGKILNIPITLPNDLYDETKIALAIQSSI